MGHVCHTYKCATPIGVAQFHKKPHILVISPCVYCFLTAGTLKFPGFFSKLLLPKIVS